MPDMRYTIMLTSCFLSFFLYLMTTEILFSWQFVANQMYEVSMDIILAGLTRFFNSSNNRRSSYDKVIQNVPLYIRD